MVSEIKKPLDKLNSELYIVKERFHDQEGKSEYADQSEAWRNKGIENRKERLRDTERLVGRKAIFTG